MTTITSDIQPRAMSRRQLLTVPLALAVTACLTGGLRSRATTTGSAEFRDRLDELRARLPNIAKYTADSVPGVQVAVILEGALAWTEGFGTPALGSGRTVDAQTIFDLGSLTKPMFTTAVLRLRERGAINLDTPLLSYFDYPDVRGQELASKVTARHVLTHTTGLPNWRPFKAGSLLTFQRAPGTAFGYSGEGMFWLQRTVEEITGIAAARLVRQEVLEPLGLARTSLVFETRFESNYAQGHGEQGAPAVDSFNKQSADRVRSVMDPNHGELQDVRYAELRRALVQATPALADGPSPVLYPSNMAASLQSTAADYAVFMTAFMAASKRPLVSGATRAEMLTSRTVIDRYTSYGLGWRLERIPAGVSFWHSGYNGGFHSFALGDPAGRYGVVVLTNSDRGDRLRWPVVHGGTGRGEAAILS